MGIFGWKWHTPFQKSRSQQKWRETTRFHTIFGQCLRDGVKKAVQKEVASCSSDLQATTIPHFHDLPCVGQSCSNSCIDRSKNIQIVETTHWHIEIQWLHSKQCNISSQIFRCELWAAEATETRKHLLSHWWLRQISRKFSLTRWAEAWQGGKDSSTMYLTWTHVTCTYQKIESI